MNPSNFEHREFLWFTTFFEAKKANQSFGFFYEPGYRFDVFSSQFEPRNSSNPKDSTPPKLSCSGLANLDFTRKSVSGFTFAEVHLNYNQLKSSWARLKDRESIKEAIRVGSLNVFHHPNKGDIPIEWPMMENDEDDFLNIPEYVKKVIGGEPELGYFNTIPSDWDSSLFYIHNHTPEAVLTDYLKTLTPAEFMKTIEWAQVVLSDTRMDDISIDGIGFLIKKVNEMKISRAMLPKSSPSPFKTRF